MANEIRATAVFLEVIEVTVSEAAVTLVYIELIRSVSDKPKPTSVVITQNT